MCLTLGKLELLSGVSGHISTKFFNLRLKDGELGNCGIAEAILQFAAIAGPDVPQAPSMEMT